MDEITKPEARSKGLSKYYTGEPCSLGHLSERYVSDGSCVKCRCTAYSRDPEGRKKCIRKYNSTEKGINCRVKHYKYPKPTHPYPKDGLCECCHNPEFKCHAKTGKLFSLALHHHHLTEEFIGWWCDICNRVEGISKGHSNRLRALADFMDKS